MMAEIGGLRFTYKGGEGSGHHGHAGRPGHVGGSAPGGGGIKLYPSEVASKLDFSHPIPRKHLDLVESLTIEEQPGEKPGYTKGSSIFLQPNFTPRIFAHEVGHVVAHNVPQKDRQKLINEMIKTPLFTAINNSPLAEKYGYDPWRMTTETFSDYYAQYAIGENIWGNPPKLIVSLFR